MVFSSVNPNQAGGGVYDSRNFEQIQLEIAWSKNIFLNLANPYKMS
jgi:hypothetical protein